MSIPTIKYYCTWRLSNAYLHTSSLMCTFYTYIWITYNIKQVILSNHFRSIYVSICDRIWENMHSLHIKFFNFGNSYHLFGICYRCETFMYCRTTIPLSFLKVSNLYILLCGFYATPNEKNRMCELCMFSHIWSYICMYVLKPNNSASTK